MLFNRHPQLTCKLTLKTPSKSPGYEVKLLHFLTEESDFKLHDVTRVNLVNLHAA